MKKPFYGGFGLVAVDGVPKPAFNAFKVLHRLGERRLNIDADSAIITRRADGTLVFALWNLVPLNTSGTMRQFTIQLPTSQKRKEALIYRVDADHGNVMPTYEKMGSPRFPTQMQLEQLRKAAELGSPESIRISGNSLNISIPVQGLAVIEIK